MIGMLMAGLSLAGCGSSSKSNPAAPNNGTLTARWNGTDGIGTLFSQRCTPCHISQSQNGYNLSNYGNAMSGGRITPGDANNSFIIKKLTGDPNVGARMPNGGPYLAASEIDTIKVWINAGALNN